MTVTEEKEMYGRHLMARIPGAELAAALNGLNDHEKAFVCRWACWMNLPLERIQKMAQVVSAWDRRGELVAHVDGLAGRL